MKIVARTSRLGVLYLPESPAEEQPGAAVLHFQVSLDPPGMTVSLR